MFVSERITVPANTTEATASETHVKVESNLLHYVAIQFPPGCKGLVHVRVWANEHPVFPSDPAKDIASDSHVIEGMMSHQFTPGYSYLNITAWNTDDTYDHTITVYASILERKYIYPQEQIGLSIQSFLKLFRLR